MRMCHFQKEVNFDINHLKIETYENLSPVNIFENQEISQERKNSPNHFCPSMFRRKKKKKKKKKNKKKNEKRKKNPKRRKFSTVQTANHSIGKANDVPTISQLAG